MNLDQDLVLAYLEEDNVQRAHFRVRPLMTNHGDIREDALQLWPDEGCLRIVPDRAEQHTFKERMRTLGHFCAIDLRGIPADAGKIRTNKNYKPERGEMNQYVLYSDTVKPLPEHTFFEVLDGSADNAVQLAEKAITPLFYLREEDTLFGPVKKSAPAKPDPAAEAIGMLFQLEAPDGAHLMLCMETPVEVKAPASAPQEPAASEPAPKAAPQPKSAPRKEKTDEPLPLGKKLTILDESKSFDETIQRLDQPLSKAANLLNSKPEASVLAAAHPQAPLSGTPLMRTQVKTSVPQPKNKLQEVVSNQWRVARYEPPTESLPAGTAMRQVDNPVETACLSLKAAWQVPETHTQLTDLILSLDGMRAKLEQKLAPSGGSTPLQKVLLSRLEDLEAERLAALVELDKAKADVENFRKTAIEALSDKRRSECTRLEQEKAAYESSIAAMQKQLATLAAQRDELIARVDDLNHSILPATLAKVMADQQLTFAADGVPLRMNCVSGVSATLDEMVARISDTMEKTGATITRNAAIALLVLLAGSPRIGLTASTPAVAATLMRNIAAAMGWLGSYAQQVSPEQKPVATFPPADATPAVLLTALNQYGPLPAITKLLLSRSIAHLTHNAAYETQSWPIVSLNATQTVLEAPEVELPPISAAALQALLTNTPITDEQIDAVFAELYPLLPPLSGASNRELHRFIAACAAHMDGGLPVACDWGILLWYLPTIERNQKTISALKPLLQEYPLSLAKLLS